MMQLCFATPSSNSRVSSSVLPSQSFTTLYVLTGKVAKSPHSVLLFGFIRLLFEIAPPKGDKPELIDLPHCLDAGSQDALDAAILFIGALVSPLSP
jgi:hypothetical protein